MGLRKFGTGQILPDDNQGISAEAAKQQRWSDEDEQQLFDEDKDS